MEKQTINVYFWLTWLLTTSCILLSSCQVLQVTTKKDFNDGFYTHHTDDKKQSVYLDIVYDTIRIYPLKKSNNTRIVDTNTVLFTFRKELDHEYNQFNAFNNTSFDIDFFTIPLKFRPKQNDVPAQLNAILNGAVYLGYRKDKYVMNYIVNPLGKSERNINHFGFSIGAFSGLGNTLMSSTNTKNILQQEYDGIVWSKGLAGILALNSSTIGLSFGFDNLLDKNKNIWIYESKPWLGLAFGLNLN